MLKNLTLIFHTWEKIVPKVLNEMFEIIIQISSLVHNTYRIINDYVSFLLNK